MLSRPMIAVSRALAPLSDSAACAVGSWTVGLATTVWVVMCEERCVSRPSPFGC